MIQGRKKTHSFNLPTAAIRQLGLLICFLTGTLSAGAQARFAFQYNGPDTIFVGEECTGILQWGHPQNPVFTPLIPGVFIQSTQITISGGYSIGSAVPAGTLVTVTYRILDTQGFESTFNFTIQFSDSTPPVFDTNELPADITVRCGENPTLTTNLVSDNCTDFDDLIIEVEDDLPFDYCEGGVIQRLYRVTDAWGNSSTFMQTITVEADPDVPVLEQAAMDLSYACDAGDAGDVLQAWLDNHGGAVVTDNCEELIWSVSPAMYDLSAACAGPVLFTFTASDYCGNSVTTTAHFELMDDVAPVLTQNAQRVFHYCDGSDIVSLFGAWLDVHGNSTATDNCANEDRLIRRFKAFGVERTRQELLDAFAENIEAGCEDDLLFGGQSYDNVLSWAIIEFIYADPCGNEVSSQSSFVVIDTLPPAWDIEPASLEIQCVDQAILEQQLTQWYEMAGGGIAQDECGYIQYEMSPTLDVALQLFRQSQLNGCGQTGNVAIEVTARDACGREADSVFMIQFTVIDTLPPTLLVSADTVQITCGPEVAEDIRTQLDALLGAVFADECGAIQPKHLVWEDSNGRQGEAAFGEYAMYPTLDSSDCTWTVWVTFEVEDECGNTALAQGTLEVIDNTSPFFTSFPADLTVDCASIPDPEMPVVSDNCRINLDVILVETSNRGADPASCSYYQYEVSRRWTASDACGNLVDSVQTIFVRDNQPPVFELTALQFVSCDSDTSVQWDQIRSLVSDNCADSVTLQLVQFVLPGNCPGNYRIERQWAATDFCDNQSTFIQQIFVSDNQAPQVVSGPQDALIGCSSESNLVLAFEAWVDSRADAVVTENCTSLRSFAAVPGTYLLSDPQSWPGQAPALDAGDCDGVYFIEQLVDFVFYDDCSNAVVTQATFRVRDEEAPVFLDCLAELTFASDPGECGAVVALPAANAFDACTGNFQQWEEEKVQFVQSATPGNLDSIVFPLDYTFNFSIPPGATLINAQIRVVLDQVDAEGAGEFFRIKAENGLDLGRTSSTIVQCGSSTTTLTLSDADINNWLTDGVTVFRLEPNLPIGQQGRFSVNDICPGAEARIQLSFEWSDNQHVVREWRINGGSRMPYDWNEGASFTLEVGEHVLEQYATDCFGNEAVCTQQLIIEDRESPSIQCPDDIELDLDSDSCSMLIKLPAYVSSSDNCGYTDSVAITTPALEQEALLAFAWDPDLQAYIAMDRTLVFEGVQAHAEGSDVRMELTLLGDVSETGDYFSIFNEDGVLMGTTESGQMNVVSGDCNTVSRIEFIIPVVDFNRWAGDGRLEFDARANRNFTIPPGGPQSGINPCDPSLVTQDGDTDGTSYLKGSLYYQANPIFVTVSGVTVYPKTLIAEPDLSPEIRLNAGQNQVLYSTLDRHGNEGSCQFNVLIRDIEAPVARCKNSILYINPSGLIQYDLDPSEIDNGSSDNCGIVRYEVNPAVFTCGEVGREFVITLTVEDATGLSNACTAVVRVESFNLMPGFDLDICNPDTLRLFGNVPPGPPGNVYSFRWTGPDNFLSFEENPIIVNPKSTNSGTYILEVLGSQNCGAVGSVTISIPEQLGVPDIGFETNLVCEGEAVVMETQLFSGNVQYQWFRGIAPNGVLVSETGAPRLAINLPPGNYSFYVVVRNSQCTSLPSVSRMVRVLEQLTAQPEPDYLEICEGEILQLGSSQSGSGYTYRWIGPDGFDRDTRQVLVSSSADASKAGTYTFIVFDNGCPSIPADVEVVVKPKPVKPIIQYNPVFCPGQTLEFTVNNIPDADAYRWLLPNNSTFATLDNQFVIQQVSDAQNGLWRLVVIRDGCESEVSDPVMVEIEESYNFQINNGGPVCEGDTIELSVQSVPGARYSWSNALGSAGSTPVIRIPATNGAMNLEIITEKNCRYEISTQVQTIPLPAITAISSDAIDCMDGSRPVCLITSVFPPDPGNYTYQWTGPSFSSSQAAPCLPNGSSALNGIYTIQITNGSGCKSEVRSIQLMIRDVPARPVIQRESSYCEGNAIHLRVADYGPGAQYVWTTPLGTQIVNGDPQLNIPLASPSQNTGMYSVRVNVDGCLSEESVVELIQVHPTPARPIIEAIGAICEGDTLRLRTNSISGAVYRWEGPETIAGSTNEVIIFPARLSNTGNYLVQTFVNGCPSPVSDAFFIQVSPIPAAPAILSSLTEVCADLAGSALELCVAEGDVVPGARYTWFQAAGGQALHGGTMSRCYTINDFANFSNGNNEFYVEVTLGGCTSLPSLPISVRIDKIPADFADAGPDLISCGNDFIAMGALPLQQATGNWTSPGSSLSINNPGDPRSLVQNLSPGDNQLIWSISYLSCRNFDQDTMQVFYQTRPEPRDDQMTVPFASFAFINVLVNDQLPGVYNLNIVRPPEHGTLTPRPNGGFEYLAFPNYVGEDYFDYEICATGCDGLCASARVFVKVGDDSICDAPNIITPNNDGTNDVFFIPCLSGGLYPNNRVTIFNEWGAVVFDESPYSNVWQGTYKGQDLPVGTYYYVIAYGEGRPDAKGFLIIKR
jgi:gliding motility-associated-like protein